MWQAPSRCPPDLDQADPAAALGREAFRVAQRRDLDAAAPRGREDALAVADFDAAPIDARAHRATAGVALAQREQLEHGTGQQLPEATQARVGDQRQQLAQARGLPRERERAPRSERARHALAARLGRHELEPVSHQRREVRALGHGDQAGVTHARARPIRDRLVPALGAEHATHRAAEDDGAQRAPGRSAAAERLDHVTQRRPELDLDEPRPGEAMVEADHLRAGASLRTERAVGLRPARGDPRRR